MPEIRRVDYGPEFHRLLLRVAGYAPDDTIAEARRALAQGRVADVAKAVGAISAAAGLALTDEDFALLAAVAPESVDALSDTQPGEWPLPPFEFQPALTDESVFAPEALPPLLDLTDAPIAFVEAVTDEVDHAAIEAMSRVPGAAALWRTWRVGSPDGLADLLARVFVVSVDVPTDELPAVTALLQEELDSVGAAETLVEVYSPDVALPAYQVQARGVSALLWTARKAYPISVARVFDGVDPEDGPWMDPDHLLLDGADREQMTAFLNAGEPVLMTTQRMDDVVDPDRRGVVPMSYRTDGVWVWTDTVTYYLRVYGLAPDEELLAYARSCDFRPALTDEVSEHRVLAALFRPAAATPTLVR